MRSDDPDHRIRAKSERCCFVSEPVSPSSTTDHELAEPAEPAVTETADRELVVEDLLVEEVSIDGMCGVY